MRHQEAITVFAKLKPDRIEEVRAVLAEIEEDVEENALFPFATMEGVHFARFVILEAAPNPGYRFTGWSQNVADPANPSTAILMTTSQTVIAGFEPCDCARDVTSSIRVTYNGFTLNPMTKRYVQTVRLENKSSTSIVAPVSLVLDQLTAAVTLYNATGITSLMPPAGSPYISATTNLSPGQSVSVQLQFTNQGNVPIAYKARVLAGPGSR